MKRQNKYLSKEWINKAQNDIKTAKILYQEKGPTDSLCFHCQQTAEKYLKGFLIFHQKEFPKAHDLILLLNLCRKIDKTFKDIQEEVIALNRYYIETRYPPEVPVYSRQECKKALKNAERIVQFIADKIL